MTTAYSNNHTRTLHHVYTHTTLDAQRDQRDRQCRCVHSDKSPRSRTSTNIDPLYPALGITNAVQGTSTNVSFKIGNRVFTTSPPFPFDKLPPELKMEIIEMALEMSKESVMSEIELFDRAAPKYRTSMLPSAITGLSSPRWTLYQPSNLSDRPSRAPKICIATTR